MLQGGMWAIPALAMYGPMVVERCPQEMSAVVSFFQLGCLAYVTDRVSSRAPWVEEQRA